MKYIRFKLLYVLLALLMITNSYATELAQVEDVTIQIISTSVDSTDEVMNDLKVPDEVTDSKKHHDKVAHDHDKVAHDHDHDKVDHDHDKIAHDHDKKHHDDFIEHDDDLISEIDKEHDLIEHDPEIGMVDKDPAIDEIIHDGPVKEETNLVHDEPKLVVDEPIAHPKEPIIEEPLKESVVVEDLVK